MTSASKYSEKENYIVPMTVKQRAGHLHVVVLKELEEHIAGKRVLHIGCNNGTTSYHINELGPSHMAGLDVNEAAIRLARVTVPTADFTTASAHEMPFEDNSFDTIVLFAIFEHLYEEDKAPAVQEFERILKSGGHILVQLPKATPGSKDEKLKQNAYDPHHVSFYFNKQNVHDDFPGWECLQIQNETRANPNNGAHHNAWVAVYQSPKKTKKKKKKSPSAQIRNTHGYSNPHDY